MLPINQIYNEDCIIGMNDIDDDSIDMILTDLPYGVTENKWDCCLPLEQLWSQWERIIKPNGAIVLTAQGLFAAKVKISNEKLFRYEWIWLKTMPTLFPSANKRPLRAHEEILVFYKNQPIYNPQFDLGIPYKKFRKSRMSQNYNPIKMMITDNKTGKRYPTTTIEFSNSKNSNRNLHPTQKPVELFEYLIKTYTNAEALILDCCIGSGTTAIASMYTDRNFIGFELDKDYFEIALERIKTEQTRIKTQGIQLDMLSSW